MKTNHFRVLTILALILLILAALAMAAAKPEPASANNCPPPEGLRPAVYIPLLGQDHYAGMWSCFEHPYRCLGR